MTGEVQELVKDYYGNALQGSEDLKTDACCTVDDLPDYLKPVMAQIHPEVSSRYYGCGLVAPELLNGLRVLDLGSGSGQDCYVLSALIGEQGEVVGVDMTDEQLAVANRHREYHREQFGYSTSNVSFHKGYLEKLDELPLQEGSFDVIVSNCVINLCEDKQAVLEQAFRLLKPGGELYFSDVYADRRVPEKLTADPVLYGECLSGALYWQDFLLLARKAGFADPRLVSDRPLGIENQEVQQKVGPIGFFSAVYRLVKAAGLEEAEQDYGQSVIYQGSIPHSGCLFAFDKYNRFPVNKAVAVSANTFAMLAQSRFAGHFEMQQGEDKHLGPFKRDGNSGLPFDIEEPSGCCG